MSHVHRLLLLSALATAAACSGDGPKLYDAGMGDAQQFDSQVVDTTPPETTITKSPAALVNTAAAHVEFTSSEADSTFACTLDGGAAQPCTSPFEMNVADGDHTFAVVATDAAGNADPTPATATWTVDTQAPDTQITKNPPALDNSTAVEFDFAADEASVTFECRLDGGAWAACTTPDMLTALADGSHTFDVRATDAAGNVDASPASYTWTIDSSTPDTVIDGGPTGAVQATTASFTFHSPNAGAGATFACGLDGAALTTCTSPKAYSGLTEADHTFTVRVTNAAGTPDPTPATRTWTVDHTAPTVTITGGPTGPTSDPTPSFPFTTAGSPTVIECKVDGNAFAACTSPYTTAPLLDGAHTVTVRVTDAAGNSGTDSQAFTVDTTPPTVVLDTRPADPTKQTSATFTFHSADGGTSFQCHVDGNAFASCASGQAYSGLAGGAGTPHTFHVIATDAAGNTGPETTFTWTIDTQAPTVVIDTHPLDPTKQTGAAFTFHSADGGTSFQCHVDGNAPASCTSGQAYAGLTGGAGTAHTFHVTTTDAAGNTSADTTFTWTIDTQAPTTTIAAASEPANPTPTTSVTFAFTSNEAGATFTCALDGGAATACNGGSMSYPGVTAQSHTFTVFATDPAGNPDPSPATYTWLVDTTPPTITRAVPATWTVDYFPFTFSGPLGGLSYQCSSNGAAFTACTSPTTQTGASFTAADTFAVRWVDAKGNPSAAAQTSWQPSQGLVLYYPLDRDAQNRSYLETYDPHDGTGGAYAFLGGLAGGALDATKPITVNATAPLSQPTGYTISFWTYWASGQTPMQGRLLDFRSATAGCTFDGDGAGTLTLDCAADPSGELGKVTATVPQGRWTLVVLRYQAPGKDVELFVDGNFAGSIANTPGDDVFSPKVAALTIADTAAASTTEWRLDDVRVYDDAIADAATQCQTYMNGTWTGQNCFVFHPALDYAMDAYPPVESANGVGTIADFASKLTAGVYGQSIAIPSTTAFWSEYFSPSVQSAHTFTAWFYDDGSGNTGTLFKDICPGTQGCSQGYIGGMSVSIAGGRLTVCGAEGFQQTPTCASGGYTTGVWHRVTIVEEAHDTGDGWATDALDALIDGKQVAQAPFTDNASIWYGTSSTMQFASMSNPNQTPGVFFDEFKAFQAVASDYGQDIDCAYFQGGTWDYAAGTCTLPPAPF